MRAIEFLPLQYGHTVLLYIIQLRIAYRKLATFLIFEDKTGDFAILESSNKLRSTAKFNGIFFNFISFSGLLLISTGCTHVDRLPCFSLYFGNFCDDYKSIVSAAALSHSSYWFGYTLF